MLSGKICGGTRQIFARDGALPIGGQSVLLSLLPAPGSAG
jgi:hypothetical protein